MGGPAPDDAEHDAGGSRRTHSGVFYNTGHGHLGWTLSAATAQMIAAAIDDWRDLDAPSMVPSQCDATETAGAAFPNYPAARGRI